MCVVEHIGLVYVNKDITWFCLVFFFFFLISFFCIGKEKCVYIYTYMLIVHSYG